MFYVAWRFVYCLSSKHFSNLFVLSECICTFNLPRVLIQGSNLLFIIYQSVFSYCQYSVVLEMTNDHSGVRHGVNIIITWAFLSYQGRARTMGCAGREYKSWKFWGAGRSSGQVVLGEVHGCGHKIGLTASLQLGSHNLVRSGTLSFLVKLCFMCFKFWTVSWFKETAVVQCEITNHYFKHF